MKIEEFIQNTSKINEAKEVIFFGGSFAPWHAGHMACVDLAPKDLPLIIIPDRNPLKENQKEQIEFLNCNLIKKEISKSAHSKIFLYDGFIQSPHKNPTIDWILDLKNNRPSQDYSLLMGFDSYQNLAKWKDFKQLLTLLKSIYICSRNETADSHDKYDSKYKKINSQLNLIYLGNHDFEELSSTQLRQKS